MIEKLQEIKNEALEEIKKCVDEASINNTRSKYLGKKSAFNEIMSDLCTLSPEEKKEVGMVSNKVREEINKSLEERLNTIKAEELNRRLEKDKIDITLPSNKKIPGTKHP